MKTYKIMLGALIILMHGEKAWMGEESACLQPVKIESPHYKIITITHDPYSIRTPVFQPIRSKPKTNHTLYTQFVLHFELVTGNC